ncbi:MAG: RNA-binding domain-containing protein [Bdellovibrionota bacterium]
MPINLKNLGIESSFENVSLEVKKATGRHGHGEVPKDAFASYSAFANTNGGIILLGIEQLGPKEFEPIGIKEPEKVIKSLWDSLNNRQQVNQNILSEKDVSILNIQNKNIIKIDVPRASRKQRPVHVGQNPLTGTYRRNFEGDYLCDSDTVKRMLADQMEDSRDGKILEKFSIEDLELDSLKIYRSIFASRKPDSPWIALDDVQFLHRIGGFAKERSENKVGLTIAGLLMFGRNETIAEVFPNVFLDYQEQSVVLEEARWIDRITPDGTWSGNLFDFYRKVIVKLIQDLKQPFQLKNSIRIDETPLHESLREALVNTIIHADYAGTVPLKIVKKGSYFEFRNPGTMRVSLEEAIYGGVSDCRNRNIQKMFRLIGVGEQAGSGVPQIYKCWSHFHWGEPKLIEKTDPPECTTLILVMKEEQKISSNKIDNKLFVEPGNELWKKALRIGKEIRFSNKSREEMKTAILSITGLGFISVENLAKILGREKNSLRNRYLSPMLKDGQLSLLYPDNINAAGQAYTIKHKSIISSQT